jgi:DNA-directed RNA polymerase specialized sigma24 family protein
MRNALDDERMDFLYRSKLHAAINALPPDLRRVVELTFQEVPDGPKGGDAITICNLVGCNEKTVYNRRKKAFEALRDALKEEEEE